MTRRASPIRALGRLVVGLGAVATVTLASAGSASAHAILDSSSPAASSVLAQAPGEVSLDFNEAVEDRLADVRLFDQDQEEIEIGRAVRLRSDPSVVVASLPPLPDGAYVVVWRVLSVDGHSVDGAFPFEIGDRTSGTANDLVDRVVDGIDTRSSVGIPLGVARLLGYLGALLLVGLVVVTWGGAVASSVRAIRALAVGVALLVAGSLGVLFLQGPHVTGGGFADVWDSVLVADVAGTRLGIAVLARLGLSLVWMLVVLGAARGLAGGSPWKNAAFLASLGTLVTFPLSGHPSSMPLAVVHVALGALHVGGLAVWVGGVLAAWSIDPDDRALVSRLSRAATWSMPLAVVSGVVLAARLTEGFDSVLSGNYGRALVAKVVVVAAVVAVAASARRRLRAEAGTRAVLRLETSLVATVLALTSVMVSSAPVAVAPPASFTASLVQSGVVADLAVSPTKVGTSEVHLIFSPPGGALEKMAEATLSISSTDRDVPPIPVDLILVGPNHWVGIVAIPYAGGWSVEIRARTPANATLRWSTSLTVDG